MFGVAVLLAISISKLVLVAGVFCKTCDTMISLLGGYFGE